MPDAEQDPSTPTRREPIRAKSPRALFIGFCLLVIALVIWTLPQVAEVQTTQDAQVSIVYLLDLDGDELLVAHIVMLALLSVGLTTIFLSMFGASVLLTFSHPIIGRGNTIKVGNAAALLAIISGALYFATSSIFEGRFAELESKNTQLESDLKAARTTAVSLEPYIRFFNFVISGGNDSVSGLKFSTQIGSKPHLGAVARSNFINGRLVDRDMLEKLLVGGNGPAKLDDQLNAYQIGRNDLELYYFDTDREVPIGELRIRVEKGLLLKVDLFVGRDFCPEPTVARNDSEARMVQFNELDGPVSDEKEY